MLKGAIFWAFLSLGIMMTVSPQQAWQTQHRRGDRAEKANLLYLQLSVDGIDLWVLIALWRDLGRDSLPLFVISFLLHPA